MWIASKNGFYSIVKHDSLPDRWLIRARDIKDLQAMFADDKIITLDIADYRYRVIVNRNELNAFLLEQGDIDYTNFKDYIAGSNQKRKLSFYHDIWMTMLTYQFESSNIKK